MSDRKKGLTLVELLIVMSILALIMSVLLPNLNDVRKSAREKKRRTDIKAISEALEMYKLDQQYPQYPPSLLSITPGQGWITNGKTYMGEFPRDPLYDANAAKYMYRYTRDPSDRTKYYLGACVEETASDTVTSGTPAEWTQSPYEGCTMFYYVTEP